MNLKNLGKIIIATGILACLPVGSAFASEMPLNNEVEEAESIEVTSSVDSMNYMDENMEASEEDEARSTSVLWSGTINCNNGIDGIAKILTMDWNKGEETSLRFSINNGGKTSIRFSVCNYATNWVIGQTTIAPGDTKTITIPGDQLPVMASQGVCTSTVIARAVNADYTPDPISFYVTANFFVN